jgi:hypothetical protein
MGEVLIVFMCWGMNRERRLSSKQIVVKPQDIGECGTYTTWSGRLWEGEIFVYQFIHE